MAKDNKPVDHIRLGNISASIWRNDTDSGTIYNATFQRSYKDGDDWKNSESFGRDDLLVLTKVADQANSRIYELQAEGRKNG